MPDTTTQFAPDRTDQRMGALARANEIRSARAVLKLDIQARKTTAAAVLAQPTPDTQTMRVADVLMATPKMGRVKVNKILAVARISGSKTVGGLSERQRGELLALLQR